MEKEEPKQEFLKQKRMSGAKTVSRILEESELKCDFCKRYPKLESTNKCESCYSVVRHFLEQDQRFKDKLLPDLRKKEETLEEAAERISKSHSVHETGQDDVYQGVIQGAKWQAERMYSEEEVKHLMTLAFEQGFKKADVVEAGLEAKETDTEVNWIFLKHKK